MLPKKLLRKLLCAVLAVLLAAGPVLPAPARAAEPGAPADLAAEALRVIGILGVMKGYTDGSMGGEKSLTRAEGAALISRMCWGGDDDSALFLEGNPGEYTDVDGHWAIGYLNYCTVRGLFHGVGDGLAAPDRPVRTVEFYKLCLTALGYRSEREGFTGGGWAGAVLSQAEKTGLAGGVASLPWENISRRDAAMVLFHMLSCGIVAYDRLRANVITETDGTLRTFGEEFLGITTAVGILAANGMAKLAAVTRPYEAFSPEPNGETTVGGLLLEENGGLVELKNLSPDLSLLGRRVIVTLSGDRTISVADAGTNVTGGTELLTDAEGQLLPLEAQVYVNSMPVEDGEAELRRAMESAERITALSNDGDEIPEYVFIDRWEYAGKLLEISEASYPGHGRAYRFEKFTRYGSYLIGSCEVGSYGRIRQIGLYSFLEPAVQRPGQTEQPAGMLALLTGISVRGGRGDLTVEVYVVPEEGEPGVRTVEGLSLNGRVIPVRDLGDGERAVAEILVGQRLDGFRSSVATGLTVLVGVLPGEQGGILLSPSFDGAPNPGVPGRLTVYSDYAAGDVSFGLGEDGRERYLDDRTVFFLEGPDGWMAYRGDIPSLEKALGQQFLEVWYANMFAPAGSDGLYLRAVIAGEEQMGVDMQKEYAFLLVLGAGAAETREGRTVYPLRVTDGAESRDILSESPAKPGDLFRGMTERDGIAALDRSSYATGALFSGKILSFGGGLLVMAGEDSNLVFDYADAKCYKIEGEQCTPAESDTLMTLAGLPAEVIGRNYGRANLIFVFK